MYKLIFLCIFFLFFGCKSKSDINKAAARNEDDKSVIAAARQTNYDISEHENYDVPSKIFFIHGTKDIDFLNNFSQDELAEFIEKLNIHASSHTAIDLNFLSKFSYIKRFTISGGITTVPSEGTGLIENFEAISHLTNLENLAISGIVLYDILPIENLRSLKDLYLSYLKINDISAIRNFENLEHLYIHCKNINNFDAVFDLVSLKHLTLEQNQFKQYLTGFQKLINLEYLRLPINQDNIPLLSNLKQLRTLKTYVFSTDDVSPLVKLPSLKELSIRYYSSVDYTILTNSNSLEDIDFGWPSYNDYLYFDKTVGDIFERNGIYISPYRHYE
jgi:hypothetical protein